MKRIGILGGTFDPIHNGHMAMAELALRQLNLDELILLPAGNPYFKKGITPYENRYMMCCLAAAQSSYRDNISVSRLEADESKPTYTYETLAKLKERDPEAELYFLCGADVLESIQTWRQPEDIFVLATLAVFERDGSENVRLSAEKLKEHFPQAECVFISGDVPDISSTLVRETVRSGGMTDELVSSAVGEYIKENGLYACHPERSEGS